MSIAFHKIKNSLVHAYAVYFNGKRIGNVQEERMNPRKHRWVCSIHGKYGPSAETRLTAAHKLVDYVTGIEMTPPVTEPLLQADEMCCFLTNADESAGYTVVRYRDKVTVTTVRQFETADAFEAWARTEGVRRLEQ